MPTLPVDRAGAKIVPAAYLGRTMNVPDQPMPASASTTSGPVDPSASAEVEVPASSPPLKVRRRRPGFVIAVVVAVIALIAAG